MDFRLKVYKYAKYSLGVIILVFLINTMTLTPKGIAFGVESVTQDLKITTTPEESFLVGKNMAPGEKISSQLTVNNQGAHDFIYYITAENEIADPLLYDLIDLSIIDSDGMRLFDGKLRELNNLPLGILGANQSSQFTFSAGFPNEATNELQGKAASVTFVFNATEHPLMLASEVVWDPPLERPDAYARSGVVMPIKFHLMNNGTIDMIKRGIDLFVYGTHNSQLVEYRFSVVDGTLEWEERGLSKPHYRLNFDARLYPITPGTYYKVFVKYGDKILGETQFKSGK